MIQPLGWASGRLRRASATTGVDPGEHLVRRWLRPRGGERQVLTGRGLEPTLNEELAATEATPSRFQDGARRDTEIQEDGPCQ